jgi:2-methylcitrate dehydratase PrpD
MSIGKVVKESVIVANHIANIRYDDLPAKVIETTKKSLLDAIGVMLAAGTLGEGCRQFVEFAETEKNKGISTILGFGSRTSATWAAFANGSMAHALDFEDTHDRARVHPNAAAIPAALAVAESNGSIDGKSLITALALASDIVCRLGLVFKQDPIKYGWYMPPILGAFGATTAACKLLNLNSSQILNAFSLTLCQATCSAELTFSPDSIIRGVRDAFSAKVGVLSAQLALRNINGFENPLEGKAGLFNLYGRKNFNIAHLTDKLGDVFEGSNVSFKPWPSCRGTHAFIEATLRFIEENSLKPDEIDEILISLDSSPVNIALCEPIETKRKPRKAIDAKFSIPFNVALAIVNKNVVLESFLPDNLTNPDVLSITPRIRYEVNNNFRRGEGAILFKKKNKVYRYKTQKSVFGHPDNPLSIEALINKFKDCAKYAPKPIPSDKINNFIEYILNLEEVPNIQTLLQNLSTSSF